MLFVTALLPFFWRVYGIIPEYETAHTAAFVGGVLTFAIILSIVWYATRAAAFGPQLEEVAEGSGGSVP